MKYTTSPLLFIMSLSLAFILPFNSCQPAAPKQEITPSNPTLPTPPSTQKQQLSPQTKAKAEWWAFQDKYVKTWKEPPSNFPYSKGAFYKAYPLNCSGECTKAAFYKRTGGGVEISEKEFLNFVTLLKEPATYNNGTAACFDPKLGVVVYDQDSVPTEYLMLCLDCNNVRTYPGKLGVTYREEELRGFSKATRKKLRKIFLKWGIDYQEHSMLWDGEEAFLKHVNSK